MLKAWSPGWCYCDLTSLRSCPFLGSQDLSFIFFLSSSFSSVRREALCSNVQPLHRPKSNRPRDHGQELRTQDSKTIIPPFKLSQILCYSNRTMISTMYVLGKSLNLAQSISLSVKETRIIPSFYTIVKEEEY